MTRIGPIFLLLGSCAAAPVQRVPAEPPHADLEMLHRALAQIDPRVAGPVGAWEFEYEGVEVMCLAQEDIDRMRLLVPIAKLTDVSDRQLTLAMEANFSGSLDARYATSRGLLFAVYVHPLSTLDLRSLPAAIHQVASLAATFGTSYTSGATAL